MSVMGCTEIVFLICFEASQMGVRTSLKVKNTVGKNRAMQSHGQVLPLCDCISQIAAGGGGGGIYINNSCSIVGEWGDEVNQQNWQGGTPHLPKIVFLFLGFVLESAGMSSKK
jgi:hypothetical protein